MPSLMLWISTKNKRRETDLLTRINQAELEVAKELLVRRQLELKPVKMKVARRKLLSKGKAKLLKEESSKLWNSL